MKCYISVVCVLSAFVAVTLAAPSTLDTYEISPIHHQVLDNVIQNVTSQVFRVVGGALLRSGGLGGGGSSGSSDGSRVSVVLPTFPPDEDDEDDDNDQSGDLDVRTRFNGNSSTTTESTDATTTTMLAVALSADDANNEISDNARVSSFSEMTTINSISSTEAESSTSSNLSTGSSPFTSPSLTSNSNTAKRNVRIARAANDQETAASGANGPNPSEDLANIDEEDADRNKRNLLFGGQSAGGSGNFLFDLIRNTADRAARTVGTVYRMIAGTENLEYSGTDTSTSSLRDDATDPDFQVVAGSGATEESDEKEAGVGGVAEVDVQGKATGEGIPGPVTRLLVIANRGIANLIQDLILRLAQTSERIVNFKARLVTALI